MSDDNKLTNSQRRLLDQIIRITQCSVCGKNLCPTPQWVYKKMVRKKSYYVTEYQCSYSCYKQQEDGRRKIPQLDRIEY